MADLKQYIGKRVRVMDSKSYYFGTIDGVDEARELVHLDEGTWVPADKCEFAPEEQEAA